MYFLKSVFVFSTFAALVAAHGALIGTGPGTNGVSGRGLGSPTPSLFPF
jgi:hypothetical protein